MQHILSSELLQAVINAAGAELSSVKDRQGTEFMWQGSKEIWPRHAPVLFPIVGKLKDNTFHVEGCAYTLSQHGFARDRVFTLAEKNETSCTFELRTDEESKTIYPFEFVFRITYTLEGSTLHTHYEVRNPSSRPLLFSLGAHPGFRCPLQAGESFGDYYLEFERSQFEVTELADGLKKDSTTPLLLRQNKLALSKTLFEKDALVFEKGQINRISLRSEVSAHTITMDCSGWPYFGIWSKKGCEEFVCLEPWYGIADKESTDQNLSTKDGIIRLEAGKSFACSFSVTFH